MFASFQTLLAATVFYIMSSWRNPTRMSNDCWKLFTLKFTESKWTSNRSRWGPRWQQLRWRRSGGNPAKAQRARSVYDTTAHGLSLEQTGMIQTFLSMTMMLYMLHVILTSSCDLCALFGFKKPLPLWSNNCSVFFKEKDITAWLRSIILPFVWTGCAPNFLGLGHNGSVDTLFQYSYFWTTKGTCFVYIDHC